MYVINKFVGWMISPMGLALAGLLFAFVCRLFRCRRVGRRLFALSLMWLWVWATPTMSRIIGASLERPFLVDGRVPRIESYPKVDAILLLGGSMGCDTNLSDSAEMWTSADRVWQAARLWKAGKAPKILVTSPHTDLTTGPLLADMGVPKDAIIYDLGPRNTEEEAKSITRMFECSECSNVEKELKILVVTSAWHMKRAMLMFEKYAPGIEVVPAPADWENSMAAAQAWTPLELLPSPPSLTWNSVTFHEWLGILGYRLFR